MKKKVLILSHVLFWIYTSLLTIFCYQLYTLPSAALGGGPDTYKQVTTTAIILIVEACIFYISYFLFIFFIKNNFRFLLLLVGYSLIILGIEIFNWSEGIDIWEILSAFLLIFHFNIIGFLFKIFALWIEEMRLNAESKE